MNGIRKTGLAVLFGVLSLSLLFFFVLVNFPYGAAVERLDALLAKEYGADLGVGSIRYRIPFRLVAGDLRIGGKDGSFEVRALDLDLRVRLLSLSRGKRVEVEGRGIRIRSDYVRTDKTSVKVLSRLKPLRLARGTPALPVDSLSLSMQGTEVERVAVAGFEFSTFKVPFVEFVLESEDQFLELKKGSVKSDLFSSEAAGRLNLERVDLNVGVRMSGEFFKRYSDLTGLLDQVGKDGAIKIRVQGRTGSPSVTIIQ